MVARQRDRRKRGFQSVSGVAVGNRTRMTARKRSTSSHGLRIFLFMTLAKSLRTWTLITPPDTSPCACDLLFGTVL